MAASVDQLPRTDPVVPEPLRRLQRAAPRRLPDDLPPALREAAQQARHADVALPAAPTLRPLSIAAGLEPHTAPLTRAAARHLLRRTGVPAGLAAVDAVVGRPAAEAAAEIVATAQAAPLLEEPAWLTTDPPPPGSSDEAWRAFDEANFDWYESLMQTFVRRHRTGGLRDKLVLFWHDHFATRHEDYYFARFVFQHFQTLYTHALGNVKDFVHAIGLDPAMLVFLNGDENRKEAPNENYARELLELFTMGITGPDGTPNYTEADIQELARALTGYWISYPELEVRFSPWIHDDGAKTIFGRTAAFDHDGVIDLIFELKHREIAHFICRKLYQTFVYPAADEAIVAALADRLLAADFDLAPVLTLLLQSAHFFDPATYATGIKSPIEAIQGQINQLDLRPAQIDDEAVFWLAFLQGQYLTNPPNVAGWPGHRAWISTATLPVRWQMAEWITWWGHDNENEGATPHPLVALADRIHDRTAPDAAFRLPLALARTLLPVGLDRLAVPAVDRPFSGDLTNHPLPDWVQAASPNELHLMKQFLGDIPWYEWSMDLAWVQYPIIRYALYVLQLPEYQLM